MCQLDLPKWCHHLIPIWRCHMATNKDCFASSYFLLSSSSIIHLYIYNLTEWDIVSACVIHGWKKSCKQECIPVGCIQYCRTRWGVSSQERGVCPGGVYSSMHWSRHPAPCEQNNWQTPVKILPSRNFIADGNNCLFCTIVTRCSIFGCWIAI